MSVIDEALRKLEDERRQQAPQDKGGEYMAAPVLLPPSTSPISRVLWMVLGGVVVAVVVWTWAKTDTQRPAPLPVPASVAAVATVPPVAPAPAGDPVAPAAAVVAAVPVATLPAQAPVQPPAQPPVLAWQSPSWVRQAATLMGQDDRAGALQGWTQGLAKLAPKDALIVLPASVSETAAVALYRSLAGQFPAVLAQENGTLRVLLIPNAGELNDVLADLRTQLKRKALTATTVSAWRSELNVAKTSVPSVSAPSAAVTAPPAAAANPARSATALIELESVSSAQGTANSSAAEILRRFTAIERMLSQGQFDTALTTVGQVEAEVGETWQTSYLKGTAAQGLRRWEEAVGALTKAHQLNPASMKVLLNRAICLQEMGKHDAALEDLRQAAVLSPGTPELVANAAYSLDALGRPAEALVQYQRFLEMTAGRDDYSKLRAWASKRVAR